LFKGGVQRQAGGHVNGIGDKTKLDDLQARLDAAFVRWETLEEPA
jgi:hypothetical protein